MKIVALLLVLTVFITCLYGGARAFDPQKYLSVVQGISGAFVDVPQELAKVWTHDYFDINTGVQWVDSILGDGLVEGIVNTCYRVIDTFGVIGGAVKLLLASELVLNPINPLYFSSYENDIYKWTDNDYIYDGVGDGPNIETVEPTVPSGHAGGR